MQLKQRHHITKIYVDGANPEVIRELKARIGEYHDYYGPTDQLALTGMGRCLYPDGQTVLIDCPPYQENRIPNVGL